MLPLYLCETCKAMWSSLCEVTSICGVKMNVCEKSESESKSEGKSYGMCFVCMSQIMDSDDAKEQCHKICDKLIK